MILVHKCTYSRCVIGVFLNSTLKWWCSGDGWHIGDCTLPTYVLLYIIFILPFIRFVTAVPYLYYCIDVCYIKYYKTSIVFSYMNNNNIIMVIGYGLLLCPFVDYTRWFIGDILYYIGTYINYMCNLRFHTVNVIIPILCRFILTMSISR